MPVDRICNRFAGYWEVVEKVLFNSWSLSGKVNDPSVSAAVNVTFWVPEIVSYYDARRSHLVVLHQFPHLETTQEYQLGSAAGNYQNRPVFRRISCIYYVIKVPQPGSSSTYNSFYSRIYYSRMPHSSPPAIQKLNGFDIGT